MFSCINFSCFLSQEPLQFSFCIAIPSFQTVQERSGFVATAFVVGYGRGRMWAVAPWNCMHAFILHGHQLVGGQRGWGGSTKWLTEVNFELPACSGHVDNDVACCRQGRKAIDDLVLTVSWNGAGRQQLDGFHFVILCWFACKLAFENDYNKMEFNFRAVKRWWMGKWVGCGALCKKWL